MVGYLRLWELLLELSSYRHTVMTSLPDKEVGKRLMSIVGRWL